MIELRKYQIEAIDSLYVYFKEHDGNPLIVLPTGTGKSIVIGEFVRGAFESYPDTRVLMVTHVKELIAQNFAALLQIWPQAPAGIYSAGLNSRDLESPILFCGIQSVHRKADHIPKCDLVLIDEAHLIPRDSGTMYRRFLAELKEINSDIKVIGFTATPYRLDSGMLHRGKAAIFDHISYEANVGDMIEQGYLCSVSTKSTDIIQDVSGVGKKGGDFILNELERAVDEDSLNQAIAKEIAAKGHDRGSWLVFATGIGHAQHLRDAIAAHGGVSAETIFGDTPSNQRSKIIERFKEGDLRCLVNVNVLTTGFDAPGVDLIGMCRPTASTGLYVQMIGRGTRPAEGKDNCLILDFAGNAVRHGPIDMVSKSGNYDPDREKGDAVVKTCPECKEVCAGGCRTCPACGFEFPPPTIDLQKKPAVVALLSREINSDWLSVTRCSYSRWRGKNGKPDSFLAEYFCGMVSYREWICLEHLGYPREKAIKWWATRIPGGPIPKDIDEALEMSDHLPDPTAIRIQKAGQYLNVVAARFD